VRGGSPELARGLETALDVAREDPETRAHVHGFHSYPARLHPVSAARLIEGLSEPGDTVLDPFAGSGTVLVEARRLGRRAIGTDVNPLAVELAHLKARGSTDAERRALVDAANHVADVAEERRATKAGPTKPYGAADRRLFDIHMLLELDGLALGIRSAPRGFVAESLKLVLSSILVKVSKQPGDTAEGVSPRRLAGGFAIKMFVRRAEELAEQLAEYAALLPQNPPLYRVDVDDARELATVKPRSVQLVVTSPPYPGVYDYAAHHDVRLRWLDIDARQFERREIGARRRAESIPRAEVLSEFRSDFSRCFSALSRVLDSEGCAAVVLADSAIQGAPLYADDEIPAIAGPAGFEMIAIASQRRPHFHADSREAFERRPRREHVFLLGKK